MPNSVYWNGRLCRSGAIPVDPADHGLLYGVGFFETFRTSGGEPHDWARHGRRLEGACAVAGIVPPAGYLVGGGKRLRRFVRALLKAHGLDDGVFRYTITAGPRLGRFGSAPYPGPSEMLSVRPLPPPSPPSGVALRVLALRRDGGEWRPRPKSLSCANALTGARELEARALAPSDEGLFLSRSGQYVVETTRQNVAWIVDGCLRYPSPSVGPVAGTCLDWVLERVDRARSCRSRLDDLLRADAVVVLNAVRGVTPVEEVWPLDDRSRLGSFRSSGHPLVRKLRAKWRESLRATAGVTG
jgi:4-amino-4-deoxychorismate lyase